MNFKHFFFLCVISVVSSQVLNSNGGWTPIQTSAETEGPPKEEATSMDRTGRFMNFKKLYTNEVETNDIEVEKKENLGNPDEALTGIYSECVMSFSLPCLQKKFLVFLDRLGRLDSFSILGDFLSVKRTTEEKGKPITEKAIEARMNYKNSEEDLELLVDYAIDRFVSLAKTKSKEKFIL